MDGPLDDAGLSDDEAPATRNLVGCEQAASACAAALNDTPRGDGADMKPAEGLTLNARLLRGAASGQLNEATSRRFGGIGTAKGASSRVTLKAAVRLGHRTARFFFFFFFAEKLIKKYKN
jgi:hypothetical protein